MKRIFTSVTAVASLLSVATLNAAPAQTSAVDAAQSCVPVGSWVMSKDKKVLPNRTMIRELAKARVILLGEDHDNPEHHRWQMQTMAQLYALQPNIVLGFESFPRQTQATLDRWVDNKLEEDAFLKEVNWDKIWTYNPEQYMPMFHFARMNKIPMLAININRELVTKVGDKGWENIPVAEREGVTDPAPAAPDYVEMLREVFGQHGSGGHGHAQPEASEPPRDATSDAAPAPAANSDEDELAAVEQNQKFQRFIQGQQVWDRAMAQSIAAALRNPNTELVVAVMGAGHVMGGYGVPHQLKALGVRDVKTLLPWDGNIACEDFDAKLIDVAFGVVDVHNEEKQKPRLGVFLEPKDEGVIVTKVIKDSVAEATGVLANDIIVEIAGKAVTKVGEVVDTVQRTVPGTFLPIRVKRNGEFVELVAKFPKDG